MILALSERTRTISALGIVQILAWGSTYYLLAVLAGPIATDTGWPSSWITAGISIGLLASGLVATQVGRLIQRHGGRPVLAGAMALIAGGLVLLAVAPSLAVYLLAWLVIGVGMGGGLYDAAFSTLGRLYGTDARRAITLLTLWGGFASTVCWPLSAALVERLGWRGACLAYAAIHISVSLPLCLVVSPWREVSQPVAQPSGQTAPSPPLRDGRFWLLAVASTTSAVLASVWSIHLMTLLQARGVSAATAVGLGTLIGPAQVGGRLLEMVSGGRHHPVWTGLISTSLIALGFAGLLAGLPAGLALVAYGAGMGLWSIARGAIPLALFGPDDYASIMGRLATPTLVASAAAPSLGAWLIATVGPSRTVGVLTATALLPVILTLVLAVAAGRGQDTPR